MVSYSNTDLAQAAWKMIKVGGTEQDVRTHAEDMANRGEADDAEYWQCVAETMERLKLIRADEPCMICGMDADETREMENGIQQHCVECGLFQIVEPLLTDWRRSPDRYKVLLADIEAYIGYCTERGAPAILNDVSMAMIKRGMYRL